MSKPPPTPPASDIDGVHRDRGDQRSSKSFDEKAQAQASAEKHEAVGRPKRDQAERDADNPVTRADRPS